MKKKTKNKIEFYLFRGLLKLLKLFPYKFSEQIIVSLFILIGYYIGIRKKVAAEQLKMVFPEKSNREIKKILLRMYAGMGKTAAETYLGNKTKLFANSVAEGWNNLEKAVAMKKGVILATGHIGNWELAGRYIAAHFKFSVVAKKQRNRYFDNYTNKLREKDNIEIIDKKNAFREIIKKLRNNYIVAILIDQNAGKNGILTNFLGFPASTFVGAAKIAIKLKCPIVPAFAVRENNGKNHFIILPMILPTNYQNNEQSIKQLTEKISSTLEKIIIDHPSDWFWVHRRWRGFKKARY
ncbi:MAG: hypothetical protein B6D62_02670 [Candidatus Cloacimonas sp. 4484_275]|nr:MAG: hypothetical protein B6D62_02670 [Candidatus Cloacimonas sp. 4484_275]RLC51402.1 MAG: hypothetical protein DRZ79_02830 [Candidatus Cloacimonadota bacterium]